MFRNSLRLATKQVSLLQKCAVANAVLVGTPFNVAVLNCTRMNFIAVQQTQARFYAKHAQKPAKSGSTPSGGFATDVLDYKDITEKMDKFVQSCQKQLNELRSGSGANPSMIENVMITMSDESKRPLKSLASIVVKNPKCLTLNVFDKTTTGAIARSIAGENLGFNPQQINDNSIDIPIPKMTKEMRENVVKNAKKAAEASKDKIRDIRRNGMTKIKAQKEGASKDDIFHDEQVLQKVTEDMIAKIDQMVEQKEKDIMKEK